MKSMFVGALLATTLITAAAPATVDARTAGPRATTTSSDAYVGQLQAFRATLTPRQIDALLGASRDWAAMGQNAGALERVQGDVARILTPRQLQDWRALTDPSLAGGGRYFSWMCVGMADLATIFGVVGWIGCPSDVSANAAKSAYAAQVNASVCALNNADTCPDAVNNAGMAYVGWSQLLASCDVADTASYSALAAYGFCGGTW